MRFWLLGLTLVLATQLAVSLLASVVVVAAHGRVRPILGRLRPAARASRLLALALAPAAAGLLAAGLVLLSWLVHEPRATSETPGPLLVAAGLGGLALVGWRAGRAGLAAVRAHRAVERLRRSGRELSGLPLPATCAAHPFPVVALAGVVRPRLLLARQVLDALGPDELEAVAAHELGHLQARDNLKRLLLLALPDPLALTPSGRALRAEFLAAAEAAADARARAHVPATVLARAIVKVAALVPPGGRLELAMAGFHHEGSLAARVRALLGDEAAGEPPAAGGRGLLASRLALALGVVTLLATATAVLAPLHAAIERAVRLLG